MDDATELTSAVISCSDWLNAYGWCVVNRCYGQ